MTYHSYDDIPIYNLGKCEEGEHSFAYIDPYNVVDSEEDQLNTYKAICAAPNGLRNKSLDDLKIKQNELEIVRFYIQVMRQFKINYSLKKIIPEDQRKELEEIKKQLLKRVSYFGLGVEDGLNIAIAESQVANLEALYNKMTDGSSNSLTVGYIMETAATLAAKPYSMEIDVHKTNATTFFLKLEEAMKIAANV